MGFPDAKVDGPEEYVGGPSGVTVAPGKEGKPSVFPPELVAYGSKAGFVIGAIPDGAVDGNDPLDRPGLPGNPGVPGNPGEVGPIGDKFVCGFEPKPWAVNGVLDNALDNAMVEPINAQQTL